MKKINLNKKLSLDKESIARLTEEQSKKIKGGQGNYELEGSCGFGSCDSTPADSCWVNSCDCSSKVSRISPL